MTDVWTLPLQPSWAATSVLAENLALAPPAAARRLERQSSSRLSTWRAEDVLSWASSFLLSADLAVLRDCDVDGPGLAQLQREHLVGSLGLSPASAALFTSRLAELLEEDSSNDSSSCPSPSPSSSNLASPSPMTTSPLPYSSPVPQAPTQRSAEVLPEVVLAEPLANAQYWLVVRSNYWLNHTSVALFDRTVLDLYCSVHEGGPNGPVTLRSFQFDLQVVNSLGSRLSYPVRADALPPPAPAPFTVQGGSAALTRFGSSATYSLRVGPTALYSEVRVCVNGEVHSFGTTVRNARTPTQDWTMDVLTDANDCSVMTLSHHKTNATWQVSLTRTALPGCTELPRAFEVRRPSRGRYSFLVPAEWRGVVAAVPTPNGAVHLFFLPGMASFVGGASVALAPPTVAAVSAKRRREDA